MEKRIIKSTEEEQNYIVEFGHYQCCPEEFKHMGSSLRIPALGLFKVHEGHPLIIRQGDSKTSVYPEISKDDKRFPMDIYRGGAPEHDFAMFLMFPGDVKLEEGNVNPRVFEKVAIIDDAFIKEKGKNEISVVYCPKGAYIEDVRFAAPAMQGQLWHFMYNCFFHSVWSLYAWPHKGWGHTLEGKILIPEDEAIDLTKGMHEIVKKRFNIS